MKLYNVFENIDDKMGFQALQLQKVAEQWLNLLVC